MTAGTTGPVQRTGTADELTLVATGGDAVTPGNEQVLTNLADGAVTATSNDAINGSQLFTTNSTLTSLSTSTSSGISSLSTGLSSTNSSVSSLSTVIAPLVDAGGALSQVGSSLGVIAQGAGGAAAGSIVTNGGLGNVGAGTLTYTQATPVASGVDSMAAGVKASVAAGVTGGTAHGAWTQVTGNNGTAIGYRSLAGSGSVALGFENRATGNQSLAIGYRNLVTGNNSGAIGDPNTISGNGSYAIGNNNTIAANNSFVLGNNVTIPVGSDNSVVLGNGSASGGANTVSVGAVGATRRITNVAPGVDLTDAVNVSQLNGVNGALNSAITNLSYNLNSVSQRAYGGVAQALGSSTINLPLDPGEYGFVGSVGLYSGQTGYNIKFQGRPSDRIMLGAGVGLSEDGTVGASAAVGIKF